MPLPFSISGHVLIAEVLESSVAASRLERALDSLKAKRVSRTGTEIRFTAGIFRAVSGMNLLVPIGSGRLSIEPVGMGLSVEYKLSFTQLFLVVSISVLGFFGPPILSAPNLTPAEAAMLLSIAWLWLYGMNVVLAVNRFPRWIQRSLKGQV